MGIRAGSTMRMLAFHFFAWPIPACFSNSVADMLLPAPRHCEHWHSMRNSLMWKSARTPLHVTPTLSGRFRISSALKCWLQCDARLSRRGWYPDSNAFASCADRGLPSGPMSVPSAFLTTPPPMSVEPSGASSPSVSSRMCLGTYLFFFGLGPGIRPVSCSRLITVRNLSASWRASSSYLAFSTSGRSRHACP